MDIKPVAGALNAIGQGLIENLYPKKRSCMFCGNFWYGSKLSSGLCPLCILKWRRFRGEASICPLCGSFDGGDPCGGPCGGERGPWPFQLGSLVGIQAAAPYTGVYRQRVLAFKYNGRKYLAASMACLMAEVWRDSRLQGGGRIKPYLVPVPMHKEKEAARGYNQSRLLAAELSRETGFPVAEALCRPVAGQMQAGLDKKQRSKALDQVFQWAGTDQRKPGPAIIVDDVVTTGATLESCGRILIEHGYQPVWGLTFAGGSGMKKSHPEKT